MSLRWLNAQTRYMRELIGAGLDGVASTAVPTVLPWRRAVFGAAAGALGGGILANRKSRPSLTAAGLLGSLVGFGAAVGWTYRKSLGPTVRCAARQVQQVRDAHWLAANPIDYA